MIVVATVVAVIPGIPVINLLVGVQVVNGLLLPINLFFIWRLSRSHKLMGEHRNHGVARRPRRHHRGRHLDAVDHPRRRHRAGTLTRGPTRR